MSDLTHDDVIAAFDNGKRKNVRLLTKAEACQELGISLSTLDRRIASGEIKVKREPRGRRHRVYVVMDGPPTEGEPDDSLIVLALAIALEKILVLQEKVEIVEEQLREERKRNSLMFEAIEAAMDQPSSRNRPRPWWRIWASPRDGCLQ